MNIFYLTPVFKPAIGGGVVYLDLLSRCLINENICNSFVIITEAFPRQLKHEFHKNGRLQVVRKYPFRAGRSEKGVLSYFRYAWQNVLFFGLPAFLRQTSVNVFIVHGSFLNHPNTLWFVLKMIRHFLPNVKIIADLRDPKLPIKKVSSLKIFDLIISCSENITQRLIAYPEIYKKTHEIPIIVDVEAPSDEAIKCVLARYNLVGVKYVFNGSGLIREKGVNRLFDLVLAIRQKGNDVALVVAGKRRHWDSRFEQAMADGWFFYVGQLSHQDVLAMTANSWLDVNLSVVDSMPRHSLEALQVGARVLLPAGVPEFDRVCSGNIGVGDSVSCLADRAIRIATCDGGICDYNIEKHLPSNVIRQYASALENIVHV